MGRYSSQLHLIWIDSRWSFSTTHARHVALPTRLSNFYQWQEKAFLITHVESLFGASSFTQGCKSGPLRYIAMSCGHHHLYIHHHVYQQLSDKGSLELIAPSMIINHLGEGSSGSSDSTGYGEIFLSETSPIPLLFCLHHLILDELQEL